MKEVFQCEACGKTFGTSKGCEVHEIKCIPDYQHLYDFVKEFEKVIENAGLEGYELHLKSDGEYFGGHLICTGIECNDREEGIFLIFEKPDWATES